MKLPLRSHRVLTLAISAILWIALPICLHAQIITTIAGSSLKGDGGPATAANLANPLGVVIDGSGNLYIADQGNHRIRKISSSGIISTVAGIGTYGYSGDGGAATAASLASPSSVAIDGDGNLYIADQDNHLIRKVSTAGIITTVVGSGSAGYGGDNGEATMADLHNPVGVAIDGSGNLYIADSQNNRIRKVSVGGTITTVAGSGIAGYGGDDGDATAAKLNNPVSVTVDGSGNLYIADQNNHRIRKVSTGGIITTVAGSGTASYGGDNGAATDADLHSPAGVALDGSGNLYIADASNHRVRMVSTGGIITTVAGDGTANYSGDDGPATSASLYFPAGVTVDGNGNLYIADQQDHRIRKVSTSGIITSYGGNGTINYGGDDGAATSASLSNPFAVAVDGSTNLYIVDQQNQRIRKVSSGGVITTVVGDGSYGYSGDGGAATAASLANPSGVAVDGNGNLYIADLQNNRIRKVSAGGAMTTVAGSGSAGYGGDNGEATLADLNNPVGVAIDGSGNLYIADSQNNRIRKVSAGGIITTVAGNGTAGYGGDGGAATAANLDNPTGIAVDGSGNLYIADQNNNRIRKVTTGGSITTVAGNGTFSYGGDGAAATDASLANPSGVAVDWSGNLYIADSRNKRIRIVSTSGIITTVAGNGDYGFSGDGGAATAASLANPVNVAVDDAGNLYIADADNQRVRKVTVPAAVRVRPVNPAAVCSASTFSLTAIATNFTATSYSWSSQPAGLTASGATPTFTAPVVNAPTVYTLTVTATDGSVSPTTSVTFTINPVPSLTLTASPSLTIASGQSATLTASGATTYVWSTSATTPSIVVTTAGVYSVTGTSLGCSAQTSTSVIGIIASVQDGNWSNASTWNCACIPTQYDVVTLSAGHHVTVSQAVQAKVLKQNGTLLINAGGKISF